jgi:two-component system, NarL family, response regulator LiaR
LWFFCLSNQVALSTKNIFERLLIKDRGIIMCTIENIITLLLADDHPLTLTGIRMAMSGFADIKIVGEAQNGEEAKELALALQPKILLLDLQMPGPRPSEIEKWVRENCPHTLTLVLTAHDRDAYLSNMIDAGAVGYLTKNETAENLIRAIRRAAMGEIVFTKEQFIRARQWKETIGDKVQSLTKREHKVLQLLTDGMDNYTISEELSITQQTVAYHVTNILRKLGVSSRHQAMAWMSINFPKTQK